MHEDIDDVYTFDKALGQGSMGAVASIRKKETGIVYALKTIQLTRMNKEMRAELRNEIDILMSLDHPNIIKPLDLFERKRQMYFVMEFCSGGDLFERMPYTEKEAARLVNQIVNAVRYLHSKNICHRDLKFEVSRFDSVEPCGVRT
jgi:calcium-dependent protein kinase